MHTLTSEQMRSQPQSLLADARRGEPTMVIEDGQPVLMAVPMGQGLDARDVRLELAIGLFVHEQISVDIAARIAGLTISDMLDELSRRSIAVASPQGEGRPGSSSAMGRA